MDTRDMHGPREILVHNSGRAAVSAYAQARGLGHPPSASGR